MPSQNKIDVHIVCNGSPLTEYPDPEDSSVGENHFRRYVEARTSQRFGVQIKLLRGFNFEYVPIVCIRVELDDAACGWYQKFRKSALDHYRGNILTTQDHTLENVQCKNDTTGNWESLPLTFGALGMSERALYRHFCAFA
jgi:hypothetical protein